MNNQNLKGAFATLRHSLSIVKNNLDAMEDLAVAEDTSVTLNLGLTSREAYVLLQTCRANIRVPNAVVKISTDVGTSEIARLLDRIRHELNG